MPFSITIIAPMQQRILDKPRPLQAPTAAASVLSHPDAAAAKLEGYESALQDAMVELKHPARLTLPERNALLQRLRKLNFVIYHCRSAPFSKSDLKALGVQLGLHRLDRNLYSDEESISSVRVSPDGEKARYIPYSNRPLGWHTDGYYNAAHRAVRSFVLHCVAPAASGGETTLLDPEIVFLMVLRRGREHIEALCDPEAFSIPPDESPNAAPASGRTGPVFTLDPAIGALHMRYTARQRSINWSTKPGIREAAELLRATIEQADGFAVHHRLEAGQGVICNNVLHKRAGFTDGAERCQQRLVYRARYYDRVLGT